MDATQLMLLLMLGVASYRLTRLALFDTILNSPRQHWYVWLLNRKYRFTKALATKMLELTSCSWCLGAHVSWAVLALWNRTWPWQFGIHGWIFAFAVMGVQGMLHAIEPGESEDHEH